MEFLGKSKKDKINFTNLILDDNLLKLIEYIRTKIDMKEFNETNNENIFERSNIQSQVRKIFKDKHKEFNIKLVNETQKINNKTNFFAINILIISDLYEIRKHKKWNKVLNGEIYNTEYFSYSFEEELDELQNDTSNNLIQCCCNKHIQKFHKLTNEETKLSLLVGCDCIEKNIILNTKQREKLKEQKNNITKTRKEMKQNRRCIDCKKYNIQDHLPSYVIRCKKCYYNYKNFKNKCYIKKSF